MVVQSLISWSQVHPSCLSIGDSCLHVQIVGISCRSMLAILSCSRLHAGMSELHTAFSVPDACSNNF